MALATKLKTIGGAEAGTIEYRSAGTYYWTCPAGVTSVTVTGRGGSLSTSTGWSDSGDGHTVVSSSTSTSSKTEIGASLTWETVESELSSIASSNNAITTSSSGGTYTKKAVTYFHWNSNTSSWWRLRVSYTKTYRRIGTYTTSYNIGTGTIPTPPAFSLDIVSGGTIQDYGTITTYGTDSTAFGYTFPDNSAEATYTNVPVTAGTQYTIVVGTDRSTDDSFVRFTF